MSCFQRSNGVPSSDAVIVRTPEATPDLADFVEEYRVDFVLDAPEEVLRFFPPEDIHTTLIIWD